MITKNIHSYDNKYDFGWQKKPDSEWNTFMEHSATTLSHQSGDRFSLF